MLPATLLLQSRTDLCYLQNGEAESIDSQDSKQTATSFVGTQVKKGVVMTLDKFRKNQQLSLCYFILHKMQAFFI